MAESIYKQWFPLYQEAKLEQTCPGLLQGLKAARFDRFMPDAMLVVAQYCKNRNLSKDTAFDVAGIAYLIATWQQHKIIYNVSDELSQELAMQAKDTDFGGELPSNLLLNLPYPCIAVKMSPFSFCCRNPDGSIGFELNSTGWGLVIAHRAKDWGDNSAGLVVAWQRSDNGISLFSLPVVEGKTIGQCAEHVLDEWIASLPGSSAMPHGCDVKARFVPALIAAQVVLYLQAINADTQKRPVGNRSKKKGKGKNNAPAIVDVGYHIAAALRQSHVYSGRERTVSAGSAKRPHTRRGHWHHYWVGPLTGERKLIIKWIDPMMIHPDGADRKPTVVPVKASKKERKKR